MSLSPTLSQGFLLGKLFKNQLATLAKAIAT
jgi:hypothetical protein